MGCYADNAGAHVLPQVAVNNSMTPELCIAIANSMAAAQPTPTKYPYLFVEYHDECYIGTALSFQASVVTSLYGAHACTDVCSGSISTYTTNGVVKTTTSTANYCGGPKQFNLYALSTTSVSFSIPVTTVSV